MYFLPRKPKGPPEVLTVTVCAFLGLAITWLLSAVLWSQPALWIRDVTLAAITLLFTIIAMAWLLRPRLFFTVLQRLQTIAGPAVLAIGLVLGITATWALLSPAHGEAPLSFFTAIYKATQFYTLSGEPTELPGQSSWREQFIAAMALLFFLCIAMQGIALLFHESLESFRLSLARGHYVICGAGRIGYQLARDLLSQKTRATVIVIERNAEHPDLPWLRENGVIVITERAEQPDVLRRAQIARAREVFVVTGSDENNVECVVEIRDKLKKLRARSRPLQCYVHLRDGDLASSMRRRLMTQGSDNDSIDIEVFNTTERTVRRLFESLSFHGLDRLPMTNEEVAHFVIIGFDKFGQSLALSLAELGHFPNCKRATMTIVDTNIAEKKERFLARHPSFTVDPTRHSHDWHEGPSGGIEFVCNASFKELTDIGDRNWVKSLDDELMKDGVKPLVFVCFDDDRQNFKLAERLKNARDRLDDRYDAFSGHGIPYKRVKSDRWPIYVWIPAQQELSQLLERPDGQESADPIPFGRCFGDVSYFEITGAWVVRLAKLLQFGYNGFEGTDEVGDRWRDLGRLVQGLPFKEKPSGDKKPSTPPPPTYSWENQQAFAHEQWRKSPEAFRASDRSAAIHAVLKLACLGLRVTDRDDEQADSGRKKAIGYLCTMQRTSKLSVKDDGSKVDSQLIDHTNLEKLSIMEHYRWCAERLLAGWTYTCEPPKDKENLKSDLKNRQHKHWNLVCFDNLGGVEHLDKIPVHILLAIAASGLLFHVKEIE